MTSPFTRRARARRGDGEHLRQEILDATEKLLRDGDESAVSIRAIASVVGVSAPSIYLHFADKEALIRQVCQRQFEKLDAAVDALMGDEADPVEQLRRRGRAYVGFGVAYPEHYRIMLMGKDYLHRAEVAPAAMVGMRSFQALADNVQACMDAGAFAPGDPLRVATLLWTAVHGMTSLRITVPAFPTFVDADGLLDELLDVMARGLAPPAI
ncbi:MAG: TetR/AcrR family transcriptional regulator [Acidimicrobiales bacterium]